MIFSKHIKHMHYVLYGLLCISCYTYSHGPLIGDKAPSFVAQTTQGVLHFPQDVEGTWTVLFSHPADFTPICESEVMRAAQLAPVLKKMNTQFVGLSTDSKLTHDIWVKSLEKVMKGHHRITFPVISDESKNIAQLYGMIHPKDHPEQAVRSVYIIDPKGIIRAILHYPTTTGRNFDEIKRLITALQVSDKYGVITTADWRPGIEPISKLPKKLNVQKDSDDDNDDER